MSGGSRNRARSAIGLGVGVLVLIVVGAVAALNRGGGWNVRDQVAASAAADEVSTPTTVAVPPTTSSTTTTTVPPTTTVVTAPPQGSPSVKALQQRLADLGYDVGPIDGFAGTQTYYAIMAFQKVEGLNRTGLDSTALRDALAKASKPGPMVPSGPPNRIEVDIDRQVLFLWQGGVLARILPVSTGSTVAYCVDGNCGDAITPTGTFHIGRKADGLEVGPLGDLWDPMYFYGGIAIHGSPSVPAYPASHGCVRVPMYASASLNAAVPSGTTVYVVGHAPPAADVPPPPDQATPPPTPTTIPPADIPTTTTVPAPVLTAPTTTTTVPPAATTVPAPTTTTTAPVVPTTAPI